MTKLILPAFPFDFHFLINTSYQWGKSHTQKKKLLSSLFCQTLLKYVFDDFD